MFKVGDKVSHYKEGVCIVTNIGRLNMRCSDSNKEYYTLVPLYDAGGTLYVPVGSEEKKIREVISTEEANCLIEDMPEIGILNVNDEKKREEIYRKALFHNQCREWVSLIKTSYQRKQKRILEGKRVIHVDDRYLSSAERFLYGELAVSLGMTKAKVQEYIADKIAGE